MENLQTLRDAVFTHADPTEAVEGCYRDFLVDFDPQHATIFMGLLEMLEKAPRIEEILLVLNYVRFPAKRAIKVDSSFA